MRATPIIPATWQQQRGLAYQRVWAAISLHLKRKSTAILLNILGGGWSWERRPIRVSVNGVNIAASMAPMPHAGRDDKPANVNVDNRSGDYGYGQNLDTIKGNNMNGHFDVHFYGSKTHASNKVDSAHQAAVRQAYEMSK